MNIISSVKQNGGEKMGKYSEYVYTEKIKEARKKKKISAEKMANLLGFSSKVTYYNIENGEAEPRITIILEIAKILGKSPSNFFKLKVQ
jgi:transcriptional regulator with XRE-family HTH domain